jgi:uncharacterized protein with ParB-like and HNH nuclease domain
MSEIDPTFNVEIIENEIDDFYSNDDLYNINSWGADLSFRELISMRDEGDLIKPELQRKYVWDRTEASRFIDSLLLGLPVPSVFLAKTKDEKYLIIDGYQRITTVYDYVKGIFSQDNKIFKLTNTEKINERWKGKAFQELNDKDQRKIRSTTIHAIIFEQVHPNVGDTSLFQIFERINTTGRTLYPQEIRNCVYQGIMNNLLIELNKNSDWRKLFGEKEEDVRMRDMEYILRFFALSNNEIKNITTSSISLKKYLNEFMGNPSNNTESSSKIFYSDFLSMVQKILNLFGENAFNNISKTTNDYIKKFHPTIFDAIAVSTSYAMKHDFDFTKITDYKDRHLKLIQNKDFMNYVSIRTTNKDHIIGRISLALEYLYGIKYE